MEGVDGEPEWSFLRGLADELISGKSAKGLEEFGEVVGHEKRLKMFFELPMSLVIVAFDGHGFLLCTQDGTAGLLRPHRNILDRTALPPLGVDPVVVSPVGSVSLDYAVSLDALPLSFGC